ncbi:hypothetical protein LTR37_007220 [Vermiconidia calcicola]|uniref:Uncharacterized protein n=1 Tax=Vermiconidia calcicola TaxID=1690605 RepID=A0ACC3NDY8_9PEZI|nr:hypothetical protein LTR37_007220 [Vermiconidia calcicola]
MRLLILGANGRTGQLAIDDALKRGHTVTALVRKAPSMQARDGVTVVQGTPLSQPDIEKAFAATPKDTIRAVLVTLNASRETDSPFSKPVSPPNLIRDSVRNVTAVMAKHSVKRIVIMSAFGVGSSYQQLPYVLRPVFRCTNMSVQMKDHDDVDAEVRKSEGLHWTLVRPAMLKEGAAAPARELGETGKGAGLLSGITRASVAEFMIKAVEEGTWMREPVVIAN